MKGITEILPSTKKYLYCAKADQWESWNATAPHLEGPTAARTSCMSRLHPDQQAILPCLVHSSSKHLCWIIWCQLLGLDAMTAALQEQSEMVYQWSMHAVSRPEAFCSSWTLTQPHLSPSPPTRGYSVYWCILPGFPSGSKNSMFYWVVRGWSGGALIVL